jgi:hypothetical protein
VAFSYLEDPGAVPDRGFEVVNLDPAEAARFRSGGDPSLIDPLEGHHLVSSLGRFVSPEVQDRLEFNPGVALLARTGTEHVEVLGARRLVDRWSVLNEPGLVVLRLSLPGTEITVGSNLPEKELLPLVATLERMELGSDLFHRMRQAQAVSDAAWEAKHHEGTDG